MTSDWINPYAVRPERSRKAGGAPGLRLPPDLIRGRTGVRLFGLSEVEGQAVRPVLRLRSARTVQIKRTLL